MPLPFHLRPWIVLAIVAGAAGICCLAWNVLPDRLHPGSEPIPEASLVRSNGEFAGSSACSECHSKIAESYRNSGMGRSLTKIENTHPVEAVGESHEFSPDGRHHYGIKQSPTGVFHYERLTDESNETLFNQAVKIDYVIGSGHQGRSYVTERDGMLFLSPIGWYSRERRWDLSPGYTLPRHLRFERVVTEGCLECHSGQMNPVSNHENRFHQPPFLEEAIGCERCHGPGQKHIQHHRRGPQATGIDPIVNPARLAPPAREDVCNQCHLQGESRYLRAGAHFGDFRPGQRLEDVYLILVAGTRATTDGTTLAVSQVEQMRSSACFQKSNGQFGCVSCHDPHSQPSRAILDDFYRDKCHKCHADRACSLPESERLKRQENDSCVACHMPRLHTNDVPHTSQTDHRILRISQTPNQAKTTAAEQIPELFDGAEQRLPRIIVDRARGIWLAEQAEARGDQELASRADRLLTIVVRQSPKDPEVLNALGTAAAVEGRVEDALTYWKQALASDPSRELTLRSSALLLLKLGRKVAAREQVEKYLQVQPRSALMWLRYAFLLEQLGETDRAIEAAKQTIEQDPSQAQAYQLLAEIYDRKADEAQRQYYLRMFNRFRTDKNRE